MTDYDVMNRCLIPQDIEVGATTIHDSTRVPCVVAADKNNADAIVTLIMVASAPRRIHFSDMNFFQQSTAKHVPTCRELGTPEWEDAKCVHFSRHATRQWNKAHGTYPARETLVREIMGL